MADNSGIPSWLAPYMPAAPGRPPIGMTADDIHALVRVIAGEEGGRNPLVQQAIAGVVINRALMTGESVYDICTAVLGKGPHLQFDGYRNPLGRSTQPNTALYDKIWANVAGVVSGTAANPAGNATYFRSVDDPKNPTPPKGFFATLGAPVGTIGNFLFYRADYGSKHPLPEDPMQPFGGNVTNLIAPSPTNPKKPLQSPIAPATYPAAKSAASPHADLSPYLQDATFPQNGPNPAVAGQPGLPPQPGAPDPAGQPQPQGALNAAPPQGGLPTGLGDYLYGPGAPAAGHAGPAPLGALALNARPPSQGVLNGSPPVAAPVGMGADITDADALALGPENAAILSRLLAKPSPQAIEPLKPTNVMLADALRALAPSDPSAGKALNGALSAPNPPALQTALAQGPLNPAGQAAQAQNPLVAALMAMRPGGSTAPAAAAYQQA